MLAEFVHSLRAKTLALALTLAIVPGVVVAAVAIVTGRHALEDAIGFRLAAAALDTAEHMTDLIVTEQKKLRAWARQEPVLGMASGDPEGRLERFLQTQKENDPAYVDVRCVNARGSVVAATEASQIGQDHARRRWVRTVRRGKEFVGVPARAEVGLHTLLDLAVPVRDPDNGGEIIGGLRGRYDWALGQAPAARAQHNTAALHLLVDILILDERGVVVAEAPPLDGIGLLQRDLRDEGWRVTRSSSHLGGASGFLREPRGQALVGYAELAAPFDNWMVLVSQPIDTAFAPIDRLQRRVLLLLAGVLVSTLGGALLLAGRAIRPLRDLTRATEELALTGETERPVEVRSRDEIGQLAAAFNTMASKLKRAQDDLVTAAKFAFVGEVAAGVAHEVRTPLGILRSSAQILGRGLGPEQAASAELVDMIVSEVDRLDRVVDGLLDLARPHEPHPEPVALRPLLERALAFVENQAVEQHATLRHDWSAPQPLAECDPDLIYQVALNLIVNALQAVPRGDGHVTVRTLPPGEGFVGFEVQDNGPGISVAEQARIFAPFVSMRRGGTGLGLAFVQRIVKAHHGSVVVESAPGTGAVFRVLLPMIKER